MIFDTEQQHTIACELLRTIYDIVVDRMKLDPEPAVMSAEACTILAMAMALVVTRSTSSRATCQAATILLVGQLQEMVTTLSREVHGEPEASS